MYAVIFKYFLLLLFVFSVNASPRIFEKCYNNGLSEFVNCASVKLLRNMEQVQHQDVFEILPGITLNRNSSHRSPKNLNIRIPENINGNSSKLLELLLSSSSQFLSDRILKIELPLNSNVSTVVARALEEGRGKMKKMMGMGPLILSLGTKLMSVVPIAFGFLVFLTTKALIVGKLAFLVSIVLLFEMVFSGRFFSNGGTHNIPPFNIQPTYGVPSTFNTNFGSNSLGGWGASGPYARSILEKEDSV